MSATLTGTGVAASEPRIEMRLYVARGSPTSERALQNLQRILQRWIPADVQWTIIDAPHCPAEAELDDIALTPTLLIKRPMHMRIAGTFERPDTIERALEAAGARRASH